MSGLGASVLKFVLDTYLAVMKSNNPSITRPKMKSTYAVHSFAGRYIEASEYRSHR
jgi:hypothetical protein